MSVIKLENNIFVLETKNTHYVMGIDKYGVNRHIYWGSKIPHCDFELNTQGDENSNHSGMDSYKQEITFFGGTLYRECAVKAEFSDKCRELEMEYKDYEINGNILCVTMRDKHYSLEITLNYEVYDDSDIIKRWLTVRNTGEDEIVFEKLFTAEFNLPSEKPYKFRNTNGAWGSEFIECESTVEGGSSVWESHRGASNHNASPYFIAYQNADENSGDVYFASLAYSGNFKVSASRDLFGLTRVMLGMNDFDFSHSLKANEQFDTPVVFCGFTQGFGEMSRQMNRYAINHILPKSFNDKILPVLYNSWEATGFDVSAAQQLELAKIAAEMGVELFVMDDGWFGQRKDDHAGLGDWYVNPDKFPNGLDELIEGINELGMDFGIWFEPEMVNPDSDLYREHPDWTYHYDTRSAKELRNQLVLNMTLPEVQEYVFGFMDELVSNHNIKYIKWDMNRPFSEIGAENLENRKMYSYLHTMAVYDICDRLKAKHTDLQIEACASGGGRAELGALEHFDQVWTSDNTDAIDRMTIQHGYTMLRPVKAMRAWVTDINWYNKPTSLDFRFNIAMQGSLGIGGELRKYSEEDKEICKRNISLYKRIRDLVQLGDLYRAYSFDEDEFLMNIYTNEEKSRAVAFIAARGTRFFKKKMNLRFAGLDENKIYHFTLDNKEYTKSGAYLMKLGIEYRIIGTDFNKIIEIEQV